MMKMNLAGSCRLKMICRAARAATRSSISISGTVPAGEQAGHLGLGPIQPFGDLLSIESSLFHGLAQPVAQLPAAYRGDMILHGSDVRAQHRRFHRPQQMSPE